MKAKTWSAAAAAFCLTAVGLAGCSSENPSDSKESTAASASTTATETAEPEEGEEATASAVPGVDAETFLETVKWEDSADGAPTLTVESPVTFSASGARVIEPGDGEAIAEGMRVTFNYVAVSGADGSVLEDTWATGAAQSVIVSQTSLDPSLATAMIGQKAGVKILWGTPGSGTDQPSSILGLVLSEAVAVPARAEGEAVEPAEGLPAVTLAESGEPSITALADATPPAELTVQTLIKGSGPVVEQDQSTTFHYSGWLWDGTAFDSSWSRGEPFTSALTQGYLIDGWIEGLVGQTVGSQVLLIVPPDKGYGDEGTGSIPAGSTLVFVVDILDAA